MEPVLANATVDVIRESTPQKIGLFRVNVWGQPPYAETRIYEIMAKNDTLAAQQGIRRFVSEMQTVSQQGNDQ
jgi:hypothetical protein